MQQTDLDRWLRKKFIYITRIYCNTLPRELPSGLLVEEAPEESGGRYLYKLSTRSEKLIERVSEALQAENITYTARVEDRQTPLNWLLNNPHKSFSMRMLWAVIAAAGLVFALSGAPQAIWARVSHKPEHSGSLVDQDNEATQKAKDDTLIYRKDSRDLMEIDKRKH